MNVLKTPTECIQQICTIGQGKPRLCLSRSIIMAFLAGTYITFGALFAIKVAGNMPIEYWGNVQRLVFGSLFPVGLLLVLLAGADLFTGNCMYLPMAAIYRKISYLGILRSWFISFFGNFAGALFVVYFLAYATGLFLDRNADGFMPLAVYTVKLANGKCDLPFFVAFWRGVGCNWLVCLAIFVAVTSTDGVSKILALWPPVTAFVAIGFEHCVANMSFIPLGIFLGQSAQYINNSVPLPELTATWKTFLVNNMIPVTLGNIVGGSIFVSMLYYKGAGLANKVTPPSNV